MGTQRNLRTKTGSVGGRSGPFVGTSRAILAQNACMRKGRRGGVSGGAAKLRLFGLLCLAVLQLHSNDRCDRCLPQPSVQIAGLSAVNGLDSIHDCPVVSDGLPVRAFVLIYWQPSWHYLR